MMSLMIKENGVTFKELEKNIYAWVCQIGREFTKEFLERYDRMLMEDRDKKKYRNKGARQTTVKTVYGEVTYQRRKKYLEIYDNLRYTDTEGQKSILFCPSFFYHT